MPAVSFRNLVKVVARSRSFRFAADLVRQSPTRELSNFRWESHKVFYRPGTTDPFVIYQILLKRGSKAEYYLPPAIKPQVIFDIGANIGASIIYFCRQFPDAKIFGFEPHPDTFRVLQQNVADLPKVTVFNFGLGASDQHIVARADKVNFGGFTTHGRFNDHGQPETSVDCQVRRLDVVLRELGISQIDLMKIDCEGAEADILSTLPDEMLRRCQWIVGEVHDPSGFRLLARLAPHFHLDLKKRMYGPRFRFHACNIDRMEAMSRSDLDALQR